MFHRERVSVVELECFLEIHDCLFALFLVRAIYLKLGYSKSSQCGCILRVMLKHELEGKLCLWKVSQLEVADADGHPDVKRHVRVYVYNSFKIVERSINSAFVVVDDRLRNNNKRLSSALIVVLLDNMFGLTELSLHQVCEAPGNLSLKIKHHFNHRV